MPDIHSTPTIETARSPANPPAEWIERVLLQQLPRGNRLALAQLYFTYFQRLRSFFLHLTASPDLAAELINDTMFDVWRRSEAIAPNISVSVWIIGIAYIHAHNRLAGSSSSQTNLPAPKSGVYHEFQGVSAIETPVQVLALPACLTVEERTTIYLVYCENQSRQEVVDTMHLSSECVDMHLTNARRKLRSSAEGAAYLLSKGHWS